MKTAINNAKENPKAMKLMAQYYNQLHAELVNSELDEEIFNTTVLSISYRLDGDFVECFRKLFRSNYMRYCHERRIYYATHDELDTEKMDVVDDYIDEELHNINLNNLIDAINKSTKENL